MGIIGAGNVGAALARALRTAGHDVTLSASALSSPRLERAATGAGAAVDDPAGAAAWSDVVVLAFPYAAAVSALSPDVAAAASGKPVIDVTNPLADDYMSLTLGHSTSAGEQIAALLPGSAVVKAFNTVFADVLESPVLGGVRQVVPVAGDDETAKEAVLALAADLGFDAVDAGPLSNARYLEPAVELLIQLGYGRGMGTGIGLALARA